ncbi:MAG: branched-chain amino acid ABC transporter permease [Rhodospirillaceae bacterium]|nr:branched-chain amino acid ABC transporter permease [Rhodospirillaceae bacterium]
MTELYLNALAGGVLIGVVYALIALGLTIIFGVMRVVNFAHGEMVVMGMYLGYWLWFATRLPPWLLMPAAAAALFLVGYALQRAIVNIFIDRPQHAQFILFIALALVITGLHLVAFGPDPKPIQSPDMMRSYHLGPLRLDAVRVQAALGALVLIAALLVFLRMSNTGRAIRAAADNLVGAQVIGIRVRRVYAITAGIGMACAGGAGALISPMFDTQPFIATDFTLIAFIVVIVGGLGSLNGALAGGILIGLAEAAAAVFVSPALKTIFSYVLLVIVLLWRPSGLLGDKAARP